MDREFPAVSELRCRSCKIMGGLTIASKRAAKAIAAFPEMEGETLRAGQRVRVDPCIPEHILVAFRAREGRPCPRVELEPCNEESAVLLSILLRDETRVLAPTWIAQNLAHLGDEDARRAVNRTIAAINSEPVLLALRPAADHQKGEQ